MKLNRAPLPALASHRVPVRALEDEGPGGHCGDSSECKDESLEHAPKQRSRRLDGHQTHVATRINSVHGSSLAR